MARSQTQVLDYLVQLEQISNEVLADKQALVSLDNEKNMNREALANLKKLKNTSPKFHDTNKSYCMLSNTFVKLENQQIEEMLKNDQKILDQKIEEIRNRLILKVARQKEAEGKTLNSGFMLKSANR